MILEQYAAATMSLSGLTGMAFKRPWGPLVCCAASSLWAWIALHDAPPKYPWAVVEAVYAGVNLFAAIRWHREEMRRPKITELPRVAGRLS